MTGLLGLLPSQFHYISAKFVRETLVLELSTLKFRLDEASQRAWSWYHVLGSKLLLHDRLIKRTILHETALLQYTRRIALVLKQQLQALGTEIQRQQADLRTQQEKIDSFESKFKATDERVQQCSEAVTRTDSQLSELLVQPQQILTSLTSAIFKFTKRFEDVFGELGNHTQTMASLEQDVKDLQHRTAWMMGFSKRERSDHVGQQVTIPTKHSHVSSRPESTPARRPGHRASHGISSSTSESVLPLKIQHFEETSASLERRIRKHERQMSDWMTAIEKRFATEQAGLVTDHAVQGQHRSSADIVSDHSSIEQLDTEKINELIEKKFRAVVTQSKNKFDVHEARIAALEEHVYKPVQQTLPVGDRLDNLEYDVGNAASQLKELTSQSSDTVESLSLLHNRVDNLRLDMKNLPKKGDDSANPETLQTMKRAIKLLEEYHSNNYAKSKEFAERLTKINNEVDQMNLRFQQLSGIHPDSTNGLDDSSTETPDYRSISCLGLKQQIDGLKADMLAMDTKVATQLHLNGIFQSQPGKTPLGVPLAPSDIPDCEWDLVSDNSPSASDRSLDAELQPRLLDHMASGAEVAEV